MGSVYYNEIDPFAASWLKNLIAAGELPKGDVDERDIRDVLPSDLDAYKQCHFFAGIGGWALALRLAEWGDEPIWTGSVPCQPFSAAGRRKGFADERHLWPAFHWLIEQCLPPVVVGEQVSSELAWIDLVSTDLEATNYSVWAIDLCAASVGVPHIRQRLWWLADRDERAVEQVGQIESGSGVGSDARERAGSCSNGESGRIRHTDNARSQGRLQLPERGDQLATGPTGVAGWEWLPCLDGKWRPTEPGIHPLAHGISNRVGKLRGYGNAIVPQLAAEVLKVFKGLRS